MLLADADRTAWDRMLIAEGLELVASLRDPGPLGLQAMIAAEHAARRRSRRPGGRASSGCTTRC